MAWADYVRPYFVCLALAGIVDVQQSPGRPSGGRGFIYLLQATFVDSSSDLDTAEAWGHVYPRRGRQTRRNDLGGDPFGRTTISGLVVDLDRHACGLNVPTACSHRRHLAPVIPLMTTRRTGSTTPISTSSLRTRPPSWILPGSPTPSHRPQAWPPTGTLAVASSEMLWRSVSFMPVCPTSSSPMFAARERPVSPSIPGPG